jgi:hypothetical protein
MHREGEDVVDALKDRGGTVAVMHVQVDDHGSPDEPIPLQYANRDRDVVDETKPFAVIGEGVVEAAAQVHRDPALASRSP